MGARVTRRPFAALRRRLRRAARDRRGGATVEFVLWAPALAAMIMVVADMALILTTNANIQHAAREAARGLARHQLSANTVEAFVQERISLGAWSDYALNVTTGPEMEVRISIPASAASVFGFYELIMPGPLSARAVMREEDPA